jgi:hypothetical protein
MMIMTKTTTTTTSSRRLLSSFYPCEAPPMRLAHYMVSEGNSSGNRAHSRAETMGPLVRGVRADLYQW